jgi:hypothetical protein
MAEQLARFALWAWLKLPLWLYHGPKPLRALSWRWLPVYGAVAYTLDDWAHPEKWRSDG